MIEKTTKFKNLKEMIAESANKFANRPAFYVDGDSLEKARVITYQEFYKDINSLGTALIEMGLKGKRIAVIGENRYEWEVAYLAISCGTGIVVPLDKALPINEIESLKAKNFEDLQDTPTDGTNDFVNIIVKEEEGNTAIEKTTGFSKKIAIIDYSNLPENQGDDTILSGLVKKVTVEITYKDKDRIETVELSTVIAKNS